MPSLAWSTIILRSNGCLCGLEPIAGTPSGSAIALELPPREAVSALRSPNHSEDIAVLEGFHSRVAEAWSRAHAESSGPCVYNSDVGTHDDAVCYGRGHAGRIDRRQQRLIEPARHKKLAAEAAKKHGLVRSGIHVPLYASSAEVLVDDAWLHNQLADGGTQRLRAAVLDVEGEKAEANVVPGLREVPARAISSHGVRHRRDSRSLMTEEFPQSTEVGFTGLVAMPVAFESTTLEILHELAVLFEGLSDGRAAGRDTPLGPKRREEWFVNVVPRLGKVRGGLLLCLTGSEREQDQQHSQAPDCGNDDLVQHRDLG